MRPISKGLLFGIITIFGYLLVVVLTTPALSPIDAISAAFQINAIVILGMGIGVGLQMYLSGYSKKLGCKIKSKSTVLGGNSGSTAATSFFSFFSLVPLGCCGWWLYILSLLPSIVGTTTSAILIEYSQSLAYVGLAIIFGFNGITILKIRKEQKHKQRKMFS